MGKTALMLVVVLALSASVICSQGQTDPSTGSATTTTTTTDDKEIHDYDIRVNSLDNGHYTIGLKNNLLLSEIDVFFDGKPVGSIPKGPAWAEFDTDKIPANVRVSGKGESYTKNMMEYVPWAYQDNNYKVIDKLIVDKSGNEIGLKVKIEYPSNLKKFEKGILDIKEITTDFGYATSPDTQNSIQTFSIIKVAGDEGLREESDYIGTDKLMLLDPIIIANGPAELLKPYNGWMVYDNNLRARVKDQYPKAIADASIAEGIERLIDMVTLGDVRKACEIALEGIFEGLDFKEICNALAKWQKEYTIGGAPSAIFSNENDYDCFTYIFGVNGYEDLCTGANGVWLKWPFSFDADGEHEIRLHFDTMFEGDIPSLGLKGGRIGEEIPIYIKINSDQSVLEEGKIDKKEVVFPDPNLEAAIRMAINKPEGAIYAADLDGLKSLDAREKSIKDITGLEYCINLEYLDLYKNHITDASPLSGLIKLKHLELGGNLITDASPLSRLTNLENLNLFGNQITDVSSLSGLTNLKFLCLSINQITDASPLSGLTNLENLNLGANPITDLSPLSGLIKLKILDLFKNQITDASSLSGFTNLTDLDLRENQITDVSPLSGLTNLENLNMFSNQITDVSPLSGLIKLKILDISNNQITDVSQLSGLTNLESLDLGGNQITDVSQLSGLTNLINLVLRENQITDVSPLSGLTNLEHLDMFGNQITDVSPSSNTYESKDNIKYLLAAGRSQDYDNALISYDRATELDPSSAEAWSGRAKALYKLGKYNEAYQSFNKSLDLDPLNATIWFMKSDALFSQASSTCLSASSCGFIDEAIQALDKAIELDPSNKEYRNFKGRALFQQEKYDSAIKCFDEAIKIDPSFAWAWLKKGIALKRLGKYDEALQCLDKAGELDPQNGAVWRIEEDIYKQQGKYYEADQASKKQQQASTKWIGGNEIWVENSA